MKDGRAEVVAWVAEHAMSCEPAVRRWLRRSRVSREDVDDLIQEAYCKLASLPSVDHISRPDGYFFQTVRNLLSEQIRRSQVVRIETVKDISALSIYSDEPSPERVAGGLQELARVRRLIEDLPPRCRRIFELRKIEGRSQREIARLLGVSESVVENEGVKGMRIIMAALREEAEYAEDLKVSHG
jgi:RNA polymerase sigma factor (sigma-70 family)